MILDDGDYATLAALTALVCDTPVAGVSLARSRQWLEFRGAGCNGAAAGTFLRDAWLWNATMKSAGVYEIADLSLDERFHANPFVRDEPRFRSYAGIPLVDATGQRIGTLGALDRRTRRMTQRRRRALGVVGAALMKSLGMHGPPPANDLEHIGMLGYALELVADPIAITRPERGAAPTFVWVNAAFIDLFEYTAEEIVGRTTRLLNGPDTDFAVLRGMVRSVDAGEAAAGTVAYYSASGKRRVVAISDRVLNDTHRIVSFRDLTREDAAAAALGDTHARLQSLLDANTDAIFTLDRDGRCTDANAAAQRLLDYPHADLLGEGLWNVAGGAVFPSGDRFPEALDEGRAFTFASTYRRRDGRLVSVECTAVPMAIRGRTEGAYVLATDVTDSRRLTELSERQAARASDLCRVAAAAGGDDSERIDAALGVVVQRFDMQAAYVAEIRGTTLLVTNRVGEPIFEVGGRIELSRTNVREMLEAQDVLAIDDLSAPSKRKRLAFGGDWHGYMCAPLHVGGRLYGAVGFFSRTVKAFDDADRDFIRLVAALISGALERRIQENELDRLAYLDGLTELPNRAHFVRLMARQFAAGVPFALYFIDLDDFKILNDRAGHAAGDLALAEVGRRLSRLCGEGEHPARLGGDEFVVVQAGDPGKLRAAAFASRIVETLREPYLLQTRSYELGASVGIAFFPRDGTKAESLMRAADAALYRAKAAGKNRVEMTPDANGAAGAQGAIHR
jgi:diguanylate cyclase (GGDEF)-like protein/PAS domain S-box-containing protein